MIQLNPYYPICRSPDTDTDIFYLSTGWIKHMCVSDEFSIVNEVGSFHFKVNTVAKAADYNNNNCYFAILGRFFESPSFLLSQQKDKQPVESVALKRSHAFQHACALQGFCS